MREIARRLAFPARDGIYLAITSAANFIIRAIDFREEKERQREREREREREKKRYNGGTGQR